MKKYEATPLYFSGEEGGNNLNCFIKVAGVLSKRTYVRIFDGKRRRVDEIYVKELNTSKGHIRSSFKV